MGARVPTVRSSILTPAAPSGRPEFHRPADPGRCPGLVSFAPLARGLTGMKKLASVYDPVHPMVSCYKSPLPNHARMPRARLAQQPNEAAWEQERVPGAGTRPRCRSMSALAKIIRTIGLSDRVIVTELS